MNITTYPSSSVKIESVLFFCGFSFKLNTHDNASKSLFLFRMWNKINRYEEREFVLFFLKKE